MQFLIASKLKSIDYIYSMLNIFFTVYDVWYTLVHIPYSIIYMLHNIHNTWHIKPHVGCTLLHWAAINNRCKIAILLLDHGADSNGIGGTLGETPLLWALRKKYYTMVQLLVQKGMYTSSFSRSFSLSLSLLVYHLLFFSFFLSLLLYWLCFPHFYVISHEVKLVQCLPYFLIFCVLLCPNFYPLYWSSINFFHIVFMLLFYKIHFAFHSINILNRTSIPLYSYFIYIAIWIYNLQSYLKIYLYHTNAYTNNNFNS